MGTLVEALPGLGPVAAMSLLLPVIFHISPIGVIIMLSGIYHNANMYTAIILNIPGDSSPVVTCLDKY